jgi:hypothetical protein
VAVERAILVLAYADGNLAGDPLGGEPALAGHGLDQAVGAKGKPGGNARDEVGGFIERGLLAGSEGARRYWGRSQALVARG